ncbi:MAG: DUF1080 domain-containing protein, partial [Planctomycetota bacterium]
MYNGGLPGAGWDGQSPKRLDGDEDTVAVLTLEKGMKRVERRSPTLGRKPPKDAVVLFDGTQKSVNEQWQKGAKLAEGNLLDVGCTSKQKFADYRMHLEFRTPFQPESRGQARGNSGVYHQGRFETQVLDSFGLEGKNNECGGIYSKRKPDLNMCLPPLVWQTYDVDFTAARYDENGQKQSDARMTVRLNGVTIHNDVVIDGPTRASRVVAGPSDGPVYLQNHGNPVRFRNIWVSRRDATRDRGLPRVVGFERFYAAGNDPVDAGRLLVSNLGCSACHAGSDGLPEKRGPVLNDVADRIHPDALLAMIRAPHAAKQGTTMPSIYHGETDAIADAEAAAIASYLMTDAGGNLPASSQRYDFGLGTAGDAAAGRGLFHSVGCVACHLPRGKDADGAAISTATSYPMGNPGTKYNLNALTNFLLNPHAVRSGGRMPKLVANAEEARQIATFLLQDRVVRLGGGQLQRWVYEVKTEKLPRFDELKPISEDVVDGIRLDGIKMKDYFAVAFESNLDVKSAGKYKFWIASDDG